MNSIEGLLLGFETALIPQNILFVTLGVLIGTVVGLLPGIGPTAGIAILLPVTFNMDPASAIIMLAGIYYGTMYGGRIPAILLNIPGDASAVITTLDGHPLARQGKAGFALGITAIGSFVGGTVAIILLTIFAPIVANFAVRIGAPEMFMLALAGIMMVTFAGSGSNLRAMIAALLGLLLGVVGLDAISGAARFTFGVVDLSAGIGIVPLAVGLFGIGEILYNAERRLGGTIISNSIGSVLPSRKQLRFVTPAMFRASALGSAIGVIPGGGGALSSILSYSVEKKFSKRPEMFGKGAADGLTATETADNASSNSAFIPMLTLGLPPNPVLAVIFGALLLQNISPGPQLVEQHPDIFWGVIASMYLGNIVLLLLNLPLIRVFIQVLRVPSNILYPVVIMIALTGVYAANNSTFDVALAIAFGVLGYLLKKFHFDLAPLVLAFILGPILEAEFSRSLLSSGGDFSIFVTRPGSATILGVLVVVLCFVGLNVFRRRMNRISHLAGK